MKSGAARLNRIIAARLLLAAVAMAVPFAVNAAPFTSADRDVLAPNTGTWDPAGVVLGGTTIRNLGLQGVGRFAANSIDPATGESIGSMSDMQITNFMNQGNGIWSGTFNVLPDRGYNAGTIFSSYAARINTFDFTFTPWTGATNAPNQNQIALTFTGSTRFTYADPATGQQVHTTGLPATGTRSLFGTTAPVAAGNTTQSDGTVNGRLTVDAEALVLDQRPGKQGSGWIGDEYGGFVYHFNANQEIDGQLRLPGAIVPHQPAGTINFDGTPTNGRRDNQGLEGVAVSGNRLFALAQSATIQDSGAGNQGRSNARLLLYDISSTDTPSDPVAQYVIQLPRVDDNGATGGVQVNRTGAQSAVIALNDHQLLILSREGNGRGASGSPVFKSILLADLSKATNIDGLFDAEGNAVTPGGVLNASVTPIEWTEALNLLGKLDLSITELEQFGLNFGPAPGDINTLSEKWEALSLVSAQDLLAPNDYFLFIANDNDFLTANVKMLDAAGNLQTYAGALENDSVVLVFRVQLVPEPGSLALAGLGFAGLWLSRRNRA